MSLPSHLENQFAALWRDHRGIFHKIARGFAPSPADEADLVQAMLVQLWRSLGSFGGECKASTWVYRVCLNTALSWKRDEGRRLKRLPIEEADDSLTCPRPDPQQTRERGERLEALYAAIRDLVPAERSLMLLFLDGLSYREIGDVAGMTENHVGVALNRVRKKLTESLKEVRDEA